MPFELSWPAEVLSQLRAATSIGYVSGSPGAVSSLKPTAAKNPGATSETPGAPVGSPGAVSFLSPTATETLTYAPAATVAAMRAYAAKIASGAHFNSELSFGEWGRRTPFTQPYVVGLTGGIASGKSTAARAARALGCVYIDSDALGHFAYAPGTAAHAEVLSAFGKGVLASDGSIDRAALGKIVFARPEQV
ncbi:dephospho-CoA kinase-domain-containing protein [Pavlovales sp. CCMP2436]|nr:dephospho-CoA kinase-domain-containing protein [Pavlovales sp. CCMP2436]